MTGRLKQTLGHRLGKLGFYQDQEGLCACRGSSAYQPNVIELPIENAHCVGGCAFQPTPQPNGCLIGDGLLQLSQVGPPPENPTLAARHHVAHGQS